MRLAGRAAVVTGASRGLGQAIAAQFVAEGADVMLVARDAAKLQSTAECLIARRAATTQKVLYQAADVAIHEQVARVVQATLEALGHIDVLVCNAAVQGPVGRLEDLAFEDWARAIEINLFGSVLFCQAVLPSMRRQQRGKIVLLSGGGATSARPRLSAYAASKTAVVRLAETLAVEVEGSGIEVNAVAPGTLNTRLLDDLRAAGPDRAGEAEYTRALQTRNEGGVPLETPARLVTFLASSESDGISGRLLSAVWDRWADLPALRERLATSDVYTLRRIEPADRGWQLG
jgi:NAD(P)-dependent dehydrogenase (short-subunit alcohol dehydrogenase family)